LKLQLKVLWKRIYLIDNIFSDETVEAKYRKPFNLAGV
jgi:hypothetical protein